jgi:hypothetical protein
MEQTYSTVIDAEGRVVMGGYAYNENGLRCLAVVRVTERGESDATFGTDDKGYVVLNGYGANVNHRYGPRAAVFKDHIAIAGCVSGPKQNNSCFGVAVINSRGDQIAKMEPDLFPGSNGTDQPWGIAFDGEGRLLVGGGSMSRGNRWRLALARYLIK